MRGMRLVVTFCLLNLIWISKADAAITVLGDTADVTVSSTAIRDGTKSWIGVSTNTSSLAAGYFFFKLPDLGPSDLPLVSSASFSLKVETAVPVDTFALDLYGLPVRSSPVMDYEEEHYIGADDSSVVKIQNDLVPLSNVNIGWFSTGAQGSANLAAYLTDQYGPTGENAGDYVLLRLNPDALFTPPVGAAGVLAHFAGLLPDEEEIVAMTPEADRPRLTLEFASVPEPTALLWPVMMAGLFFGRRR